MQHTRRNGSWSLIRLARLCQIFQLLCFTSLECLVCFPSGGWHERGSAESQARLGGFSGGPRPDLIWQRHHVCGSGRAWWKIPPTTHKHPQGQPPSEMSESCPRSQGCNHGPPLPTPAPQFSWLACRFLDDTSTSPGLRVRMAEVENPSKSTSSIARFHSQLLKF